MLNDIAGHVIVDIRVASPGTLQKRIEITGNFDHGLVLIFRQDEIDGHSSRASVMGDQTPGNFSRVQGDPLDTGNVRIGQ